MSFSATYLPKYILRNLYEIAPLPGREREYQSHQIQTSVTIVQFYFQITNDTICVSLVDQCED